MFLLIVTKFQLAVFVNLDLVVVETFVNSGIRGFLSLTVNLNLFYSILSIRDGAVVLVHIDGDGVEVASDGLP